MPIRSKRSLSSNDRKPPRSSKQAKVEVVIVDKSPSKYSTASSDSVPLSKLKQRAGNASKRKETPASKKPPREAQKVLFSKSRKIISSDEEDEEDSSDEEEESGEEEWSSEEESYKDEELTGEESPSSGEEWKAQGSVKRKKATKPKKAAKPKKSTPHPKKNTVKAKAAAKAAAKNSDVEIVGANLDSDSDDEDIPNSTVGQYLSEYEKKRLQNIQENAVFFESIDLQSAKNDLSDVSAKKSSRSRGLQVKRKWEHRPNPTPRPRSLRLQNKNPEGADLPPKPEPLPLYQDMHEERTGPTYKHFFIQRHTGVRRGLTGKHKGTPFGPRKPAGPLDMAATNVKGDDKGLGDRFQQDLHKLSKASSLESEVKQRLTVTQESFLKSVQSMTIAEERVAKVTPERIFSVAVHPSTTKMLVCAGDKWGRLGLWDVESQGGDDGVYLYNPHSRPISCLQFSPVHHGKLYMCSYDGTMRCAEFEKDVFSEVFSTEEGTDLLVKYFDFLSEDGTTCLLGLGDGDVAVVDTRTKGCEAEHLYPAHDRTIKTVSVHPTQRHYFVSCCNDSNVYIYDLRNMKKKGGQQFVASLYQHSRSVSSAYFSPASGSRILTTCFDDRIRVFDTSVIGQKTLHELRHNNQTGRWLTPFRAAWVPGRDDLFVTGSMKQPRQIELYSDQASLLHTFTSPDYLTSICSINAFHPTQCLLAGGNSSGKVHVFSSSSFSASSKKSPGSPRVMLKKLSV